MNTAEHPSEVARMREHIELEVLAMQRALSGLASGAARHEFIQAKMNRLGEHQQQLQQIVGEQEASRILCETYHKTMS